MKNRLIKMNDGSHYLSLGNIFNIIKKNSINKSNALQTELFLIIFGIEEIGTTTVNNYCIGSRAIAMEYKRKFYILRDSKEKFMDVLIDIINILEDMIHLPNDKENFINSNIQLYKVCLDILSIVEEDSNLGFDQKQKFKENLEKKELISFMFDALSYSIIDNKQPILKQDISNYLKNKDLEEFISMNLFEGFNYYNALKRIADKGNMFANLELATMEYNLKLHGYEESYKYYLKAADKGHPKACWMVAYMHYKRLVSFDYDEMLYYLNKALELGSIPAINMMGNLYYFGIIEEKNVEKARQYYEEAASLGYAYAYNNLGKLALDEKNERAAIKYFKMSADLGESWALNKLGEYYRKKNKLNEAFFYYKTSTETYYYEKHYYAYYNLAKYFYLDGVEELNIEKDLNKALKFAKIAYDNGIEEALDLIKFIENI